MKYTGVRKSRFTVVCMQRRAGYDYYNSFINSKDNVQWHCTPTFAQLYILQGNLAHAHT